MWQLIISNSNDDTLEVPSLHPCIYTLIYIYIYIYMHIYKNEFTVVLFRSRWNNYKDNTRKCVRGATVWKGICINT